MEKENDVLIKFPNVVLGVSGGNSEGPQIVSPIVRTNGETDYVILWTPVINDPSYGGGYTDAKHTGDNVLVARGSSTPRVCIIDVETKKTIWYEDYDLLEYNVTGGVHSATYTDRGVVVCVPNSYDLTQDNLVFINDSNPQEMQKIDFPDCHAAIWVNSGPGKGFLWAVGRSTPPNNSEYAEKGKCLLRKYDNNGGEGKFTLVDTFTLIENPGELDELEFSGWWESPHDIAIYDENTLWISTDLQVIAFDLKNNKVLSSPISHDVFQSFEEITDAPSATNIKGLRIYGDSILYTQGIGGDSSIKEFCIVKNKKKYTFKIKDGGEIYKARWAYDL